MSRGSYPAADDLSRFLTAAGFATGDLDLSGAVEAARAELERRTDRRLLADAADVLRRFDPPADPGGYLALEGDLAALTSVQYQPEGAAAESLTLDSDFWLEPVNATAEGRPWRGIRFRRRWWLPVPAALRRSIRVTGRWGFALTVPDDAWTAILHGAAALLAVQEGHRLSAGRRRAASAGVETDWGEDPLAGAREAWRRTFEEAVRRYRVG